MCTEKTLWKSRIGRLLLRLALAALAASSASAVTVDLSVVDDPDRHVFANFNYTLTDAEGDPATVLIEYSLNGTDFVELDTLDDRTTSPGGTTHAFEWLTLNQEDVRAADVTAWLRMTATDKNGTASDTAGPFPIYNQPRINVSFDVTGPGADTAPDVPSRVLVRGQPFHIGVGISIHNPYWYWPDDRLGLVEFGASINGTSIGGDADTFGSSIDDKYVGLEVDDVFPADFPVADSYTLTIGGSAYYLDWGPISIPVDILPPDAFISVTSPNGGESWCRGTTHEVTWESNAGGSVRVWLFRGPSGNPDLWDLLLTIEEYGDNDGGCLWQIPADLPPGDDYLAVVVLLADTGIWGASAECFSIIADTEPPVVNNVAAVPSTVREGLDGSVLLTATATDEGCEVAAAECFVGADPGAGNATAMAAADGAFDSDVEALVTTVDASGWALGPVTLGVRAKDAVGNWSAAVTIEVDVVETDPPGNITDLAAQAMPSLMSIPVTELPYPYTNQNEVTYDVGGVIKVGAVSLTPARPFSLFPKDFAIAVSQDNSSWTAVAEARAFRAAAGSCLWQFEPADARYVKISGPGIYGSAAAVIYKSLGTAAARLTWTAPADDGYTGGAAAQYDVRCNGQPVDGIGVPKNPGQLEDYVVGVDVTGTAHFAVTTADEVPNWSDPSNDASDTLYSSGLVSQEPANCISVDALAPPAFRFRIEPGMTNATICFSSCAGFPAVATERNDGQIDKCVKFGLKTTADVWTPRASQWKTIKALACTEDTVWWRLEGKHDAYGTVFGPVRYVFFDCGEIADLDVEPSHDKSGDTAVWPDKTTPPRFSWTYDGSGVAPAALMTYFWVDISTDGNVPLGDGARTLTVGGSGIKAWSYTLTTAQWKNVLQLATKGNGTLYWRVRGKDAGKVLECASVVKTLVVDRGTLVLAPFKLTDSPCTATWSHTDKGAVTYKYYLQFSPDDSFDRREAWIVKMPGTGTLDAMYMLPESKRRAILKRAGKPKSGVTAVYCRVRAEDANKAFVTYGNTVEVWP